MPKSLNALLLFILFGVILLFYYTVDMNKSSFLYTDYGRFYASDELATAKKNIYTPTYVVIQKQGEESKTKLSDNLNPPFFQLLIYPLGLVSYGTSLILWTFLSVCCAMVSLIYAWKIIAIEPSRTLFLAVVVAFFTYSPVFTNIQCGQVSLFLLLPITLAWYAIKRNQNNLAAILLGIAASCKPFLLLFVLFFLFRRRWIALLYFCTSLLSCYLLAIAAFGPHTYANYLPILQHISWYADNWNASLLGLLTRMFGTHYEKKFLASYSPEFTTAIYYFLGCGFVFYLRFFLQAKNRSLASGDKTDLDFSLILITSLILSPLGWIYYFTFLLIPFMLLFKYLLQQRMSLNEVFLLFGALFLSNLDTTLIASNELNLQNLYWNFLSGACYFSSLILLLICCSKMYRLKPHPQKLKPVVTFDAFELSLLIIITMLPSLLATIWQINLFALGGEHLILQVNEVFFAN